MPKYGTVSQVLLQMVVAYVTERNLVTLSLRFCSRDSPLRLPIQEGSFIKFNFLD